MSTQDPMTPERLADARATLDEDMSQWGAEYGVDLLAEVERLRALATVTRDGVERGARAFYERLAPGVYLSRNWDKLAAASPDIADAYRAGIRAALEAVIGAGGTHE